MPRSSRPSRRLRRVSAATVLAGALALGACGEAVPTGAAASVNGEQITTEFLGEVVKVERARLLDQGASDEDAQALLADFQRQTLSQLILGILFEQEAAQRGIELTEQEKTDLWDEQVAIAGGEDALLARIAELGLTEADARQRIEQNALVQRLQEDVRATVVVDEEELRALYEQRADQYNLRGTSHISQDTQEGAQEIFDLLASGEATFEDLAAERSTDTSSGPLGGGLGENPRGTFPEAFDNAVWAAEEGAIIGPIETTFGWHVVRIDSVRSVSFDEVAQQLDEELRGQRFQAEFQALVQALVVESDIRIDGRFGEWDELAREVVDVDLLARPTS